MLHTKHIDKRWQLEHQLEVLFEYSNDYIAGTQNGKYKTLMLRVDCTKHNYGNIGAKKLSLSEDSTSQETKLDICKYLNNPMNNLREVLLQMLSLLLALALAIL